MKKILFFLIISMFCFSFTILEAQETIDTEMVDINSEEISSASISQIEAILSETIGSDEVISSEPQELNGVEIEEIKNIPSEFGLMWQDFKQNLSLILTFDKFKKAEKRLLYAENKIKIANFIAEQSDSPKVQKKAQKMIEVANKHIAKIEEDKDKVFENIDDKKAKFIENLAIHKLNKEKVLEKIEDKVSEDKLEEFQIFRDKITEKKDIFLEKIENNPNIPEKSKQKILEVQSAIQEKRLERKQTRLQISSLVEQVKNGNQGAKDQLEQLKLHIKENRENEIKNLKERRDSLIEKIKSKDTESKNKAIDEIKKLNLEKRVKNLGIKMDINSVKTELKNDGNSLKKGTRQIIQEANRKLNNSTTTQ